MNNKIDKLTWHLFLSPDESTAAVRRAQDEANSREEQHQQDIQQLHQQHQQALEVLRQQHKQEIDLGTVLLEYFYFCDFS